jgi:hypothetical protein
VVRPLLVSVLFLVRPPWTDLCWVRPPWDFSLLLVWGYGFSSCAGVGAATLIWLLSSGAALSWLVPLADMRVRPSPG